LDVFQTTWTGGENLIWILDKYSYTASWCSSPPAAAPNSPRRDTHTPTAIATGTPTFTATPPVIVVIPSSTPTKTPTHRATPMVSVTATFTPALELFHTPTRTPTLVFTPAISPAVTATLIWVRTLVVFPPTATPTPTPTLTPTRVPTETPRDSDITKHLLLPDDNSSGKWRVSPEFACWDGVASDTPPTEVSRSGFLVMIR
jgi:hypothetical protein